MKAPTPCIECHEPSTKYNRCEQHQPAAWVGSTRRERLPKDWSTKRTIVLKRDRGVCHLCGQPGADSVDHIVAGDDHSLDNLAPAHDKVPPHCHRYKSSIEGNEARARVREQRKKH